MTLYFGDLLPYGPLLLEALGTSLYLTVIAMFVGSAFGVLLYLGKTGPVRPLSVLSNAYIESFRNTPLLVQIYLIYFGSSQFGIHLDPISSGIIAMTLNNAAYTAEIYRAGFESVPNGLREAGRALGMHSRQIFRHALFMPATRNVFPALTNQFILLFLASSIASVIGLPELMNTVMNISSQTNRVIEILAVGGLMYYAASSLLAVASRFAERKLFAWGVKTYV
jgi:polar amino acid transport system permease protein